jgi:type II secretory pathway pseudopilin PulG
MMIEVLVAIGVLGTAVLAALMSISTAAAVTSRVSEEANAEWLAASQIDIVRAAPFALTPANYPAITAPTGYTVTNTTAEFIVGQTNIQRVTITVLRDGQAVYTTSLLKVNR